MCDIITNTDLNFVAFLVATVLIVFLFLKYKGQLCGKAIHLMYISAILVFLLIGVVSFFCVNNDPEKILFNYLSFTSTITSIILSVLAIIFTVWSNNSLDALKDLPKTIQDEVRRSMETLVDSTNELKLMVDN